MASAPARFSVLRQMFFDANCYFGRPPKIPVSPALCPTIGDLEAALDRAGIVRALVWHVAQLEVAPAVGNRWLAEAIAGRPRFTGCWTLLPPQTGEMTPETLFPRMREANIRALRAFPGRHRYVLNGLTLGALLEGMVERRIPLLYSFRMSSPGADAAGVWSEIHALLKDFPQLTLILCDHGSWGCDRFFRPLLDRYERVFVDTSLYFLDGGLESLVERYGDRAPVVFGSGLPERYPGGMMMALRHGELSEAARAAISGGTLARLIGEARP